jgi:hypothetical protein
MFTIRNRLEDELSRGIAFYFVRRVLASGFSFGAGQRIARRNAGR